MYLFFLLALGRLVYKKERETFSLLSFEYEMEIVLHITERGLNCSQSGIEAALLLRHQRKSVVTRQTPPIALLEAYLTGSAGHSHFRGLIRRIKGSSRH